MSKFIAAFLLVFSIHSLSAQLLSHQKTFTHADTLRGSIGPGRAWWDLLHYDLHVQFHISDSSISGYNVIQYRAVDKQQRMQIDLMQPLIIDSIVQQGIRQKFTCDGNAYFIDLPPVIAVSNLIVYYHGKPQIAKRPPWDGGVIWAKDKKGRPWISVACQGLGASVWFPCKDHQADEPDSVSIYVTVPDSLVAVANGRLQTIHRAGHSATYHWMVANPINNYNIIPYIGHYELFSQIYTGENGPLDTRYWVLDYNLAAAKNHLRENVEKTLKNLEYWFGPYPFYEDGYQIVDAPHLGMEHQSAIAYGNGYQNGYLGHDLSGTGWGLKWDFIVVHESAHEWFGNNITTKDLADMWVHESFANYAETLFTTSELGVQAGNDYVIGCRKNIQNDVPIIGIYNVNEEGSGDMYYKGGNMIHTIRQIINDDEKFRQILRGLNKTFYHQTVTSQQIESYISEKSGINFSKVFDQYLRTTQVPVLSHYVKADNPKESTLNYAWTNCIPGFDMPLKIQLEQGRQIWLKPKTEYQGTITVRPSYNQEKIADRNFYVNEARDLSKH